MNNNALLVRINYISEDSLGIDTIDNSYRAHVVRNEKTEENKKYMLCSGIINKRSGTIIYNARNKKEAKEIAKNNMMTNHEHRKYREVKRDIVTIPSRLINS